MSISGRTRSIFSEIIWHKLQRWLYPMFGPCFPSRGQQFVRQKIYCEPFQDRYYVSMKYLTRLAHITCNTDSSVKSATALQGIAPPACINEVFETYFVDSRRREYCDVLSRRLLVLQW